MYFMGSLTSLGIVNPKIFKFDLFEQYSLLPGFDEHIIPPVSSLFYQFVLSMPVSMLKSRFNWSDDRNLRRKTLE